MDRPSLQARLLVLLALLAGPVALVLVCAHLAGAYPPPGGSWPLWYLMTRPARRNAAGDVELRPTPSPIPTRAIATPVE